MLLTLAACAKDRTAADTAAAAGGRTAPGDTGSLSGMRPTAGQDSTAMKGMSGMKGMGADSGGAGGMMGMSGMTSMMGDMQKQMDGMMKATPEQMKAMMPAHRQMAANMLAGMNAEMRKMNMGGDAAWTATVDSVRNDLRHMPDLNGREMMAAMPAHHARMKRIMTMHQAMTQGMKSP